MTVSHFSAMLKGMATYPGGKNGPGVYQRIISLMPPHQTYIEPFLGGGAIMRLKRPASLNIGIDRDRVPVEKARPPAEALDIAMEASSAGKGGWIRASEESRDPLMRTLDTPAARWVFNQDDGIEFLKFVLTWWHRLFELDGPGADLLRPALYASHVREPMPVQVRSCRRRPPPPVASAPGS